MVENDCPIISLCHTIGKKWSIKIIEELYFSKKNSFNELLKRLKIVSPKILSQRLKELEKRELIKKTMLTHESKTLNSSYSLTTKGKELQDLINGLKKFGMKWENVNKKCLSTKCTECNQEF